MELGFNISNKNEKAGLEKVKQLTGLHGRWDVISQNPMIVLDVAHNEDGIRQVLKQLVHLNYHFPQVHFVTGMVKDKEIDKVLNILPKEANYYFTNAHIPRALPHEELKKKAAQFDLKGKSFDNVNAALAEARQNSKPDDIIVVCGSVFLVGEVETK